MSQFKLPVIKVNFVIIFKDNFDLTWLIYKIYTIFLKKLIFLPNYKNQLIQLYLSGITEYSMCQCQYVNKEK